MSDVLTLVLAGDLVLDEPDPRHWLSGIAPALREADIAIGHLEVPHTDSCEEVAGDVPSPGAPPEHLAALVEAGFAMVSLAGNHMADCGAQGIADTIAGLDALGIAHAGAGADLASARRPAVVTRADKRIALLSYNCVGPAWGWAAADRAGVAYLPLQTADGEPVTPRSTITGIDPQAYAILAEDIAAAYALADFVIVAMHKGRVHTPAMLEQYERPLVEAAIELGADAVIGHHAHIIHGVQFYRGKPVFHGLGNGCVVTRALSPAQDHPARREWAERRKALFGFEPDPDYPLAPFHPEAKHAVLGSLQLGDDGSVRTSIVPVWVEPPGRPVLASDQRADQVKRYLERITVAEGLPPIAVDAAGRLERVA
ncbi:MAG TPA: CapA family protein [Croceibacterium sp.]|nr:CapA family protein [Croceibacterium sp.]